MTNIKKALSLILVFSVLISALFIQFSFGALAENKKGTVIADSLNIREEANTSSRQLGSIPGGKTVEILGETTGQEITNGTSSNIWYKVTYGGITGYVSSVYIKLIPQYVEDANFEAHISAFPDSYKPFLRELHAQYPNWKFYPDNIDMSFSNAVAIQESRKLTSDKISWRTMGLGGYDWNTGVWAQPESGWYRASREVIRYYIDPRSYLNVSSVFAFLPQNFDSNSQTEEGVQKVINGTFLADGYSDPNDTAYDGSYSKVIMEAAKQTGVNPYVLAATIIQEQGTGGTSPIISGEYSGYENLYNFFNIRAYGSSKDEIYKNGLTYARDRGWTTRSASIIGGAAFCANDYLSVNQNTYYYMNFNVKNPDKIYHQYATAIHDTNSKAVKVSQSYKELPNAELSFTVPVYRDMPSEVTPAPEKSDKLNNYYFTNISASGLTPSFSMFTYSYDLNVWSDANINITVPEGATYVSATSFSLGVGQNRVVLTVKSQTGYINDYIINVRADKACTLYVNNPSVPAVNYKKGDTNGDGKINGRDLANVQMHILGVRSFSGDVLKAFDTNGDGKINGRDLANIQMDILGIRKLT